MLTELCIPRRRGTYFDQPPEAARPVITYSEGISFHLNGGQVRVFLAPPAHTDGGSFLGMIEAMGMAIGIAGPDTKVIPGHGEGVADHDDMLEVENLLLTLRQRVHTHGKHF